ncbi:putative CheR-type MCP methyltransferase [Megalodesulfovibrio gigas DSM 1382 = ATCC 19364]|uniref:Putative CheR-type MCP methyltransferase n=1 Tax=Megalodesulfovibrio gigas (strain ATCC 19364 / DSM 1382 / NCIMB 9332 / VKM B-1759) TaxID=1121448 RepID=T2GAW6_MEGG1|nr:putative CheR-type MCP methyltransferase [Megalodesulfovibrio gigas DSM 1382 = ATCC 19364]
MLSPLLYRQVAQRIADRTGMAYLTDRQTDFERRLDAAARELGQELGVFASAIVSGGLTAAQWDVLADHLAVAETYFFREMRTLAMLEAHVLPALAQQADREQRGLRIWSAGCCTGEEPYTLAIMLHRAGLWRSGRENLLLATDLNPRFLHKAQAGGYRQWSFRGSPDWLLEYFVQESSQIRRIIPAIRKMVRFEQLNLASPGWPRDMCREFDLILCRNVLLYFTKDGMREVTARFTGRMAQGGWLVTAPAEAAHLMELELLEPVRLESALLFRKGGECSPWSCLLPEVQPSANMLEQADAEQDTRPYLPDGEWPESGSEPEVAAFPVAAKLEPVGLDAAVPAMEGDWPARAASLARQLADAGRLEEAGRWVAKALETARLDPALHHLDGVIHAAAGNEEDARKAWRKALYLDPSLVMTRYLLLCLERDAGAVAAVATHARVLLDQLQGLPPDALAPNAEGLSAGRLRELVEQVLFME